MFYGMYISNRSVICKFRSFFVCFVIFLERLGLMRILGYVLIINLLQLFISKNLIIGIFSCLSFIFVEFQTSILIISLLFIWCPDRPISILYSFLFPLHHLIFILCNRWNRLKLWCLFMQLIQILYGLIRLSSLLLFFKLCLIIIDLSL